MIFVVVAQCADRVLKFDRQLHEAERNYESIRIEYQFPVTVLNCIELQVVQIRNDDLWAQFQFVENQLAEAEPASFGSNNEETQALPSKEMVDLVVGCFSGEGRKCGAVSS